MTTELEDRFSCVGREDHITNDKLLPPAIENSLCKLRFDDTYQKRSVRRILFVLLDSIQKGSACEDIAQAVIPITCAAKTPGVQPLLRCMRSRAERIITHLDLPIFLPNADIDISQHRFAEQLDRAAFRIADLLDDLSAQLWGRSSFSGGLEGVHMAVLASEFATSLIPMDHHDKPYYLNNLGNALEFRFERLEVRNDIEDAIAVHRLAIELLNEHADMPKFLNNLGVSLNGIFEMYGDERHINEAIQVKRQAVNLTPDGHPNRPSFLHDLGVSLSSRFDQLGAAADIEDAIAMMRLAMSLCPDQHPSQPLYLLNLSTALNSRFTKFGNTVDLEDAITAAQRSIRLAPEGLADKFRYYNALWQALENRFGVRGDPSDIADAITAIRHAIQLLPDGHSNRPGYLGNLGISLRTSFLRYGRVADLEEAVTYMRLAVDLTPNGHSLKGMFLNNLGASLDSRFYRFGDLNDLDESTSVKRLCIQLTSDAHPNKPMYANNLGATLKARFSRLGNPDDLDEAIKMMRRAIELAPDTHPSKAMFLNNLGIALETRFLRFDRLTDIDESILVTRQSVNICPDGHPSKPSHLRRLGSGYRNRFDRRANLLDIEDAIAALRVAVDLIPDDHSEKLPCLHDLAISLRSRFNRLGTLADLNDAIIIKRRVVDSTSEDDARKPMYLNNLGNSLDVRFSKLGDMADIEDAITVSRRSIDLTADEHPSKPSYLQILGNSLERRFHKLHNLADIEASIAAKRLSTKLTPPDHPNRPTRLNNLGNALCRRFEASNYRSDLNEAIAFQRSAVDSLPSNHHYMSMFLVNLADSYRIRFRSSRDPLDIQEAYQLFMRGLRHEAGQPNHRLLAATSCTHMCMQHSNLTTTDQLLQVYEESMPLIPEVVWFGHDINRRYEELSHLAGFSSAAAAAALSAGKPTLALEWLEQGRGVVWGQLLQLRTPIDDLRSRHPQLASRLHEASRTLEGLSPFQPVQPMLLLDNQSQTTSRRVRAAEEYKDVLSDIRQQRDFERFLMPKPYAEFAPSRHTGFVIVVNVEHSRCDALITCFSHPVAHVPLPNLTYDTAQKMCLTFVDVLGRSGVRSRASCPVKQPITGGEVQRILELLWNLVVQPILRALEEKFHSTRPEGDLPHVTWCANGPLAFLPLHAAGIYGKTSQEADRVFGHVVSSYAPTVSALSLKPLEHSMTGTSRNILVISQPNTPGLQSLPGTSTEVESVKTHFSPNQLTSLDHDAATTGAVLHALDELRPQIVHFACHGIQDSVQPTNSAFMLYDGPLTLSTLMTRTASNAEIAFLSACQTATGDQKLPEEAVHLAAGMLAVGFRAVLGTIWSIGDEDAPIIADEVYMQIARHGNNTRSVAYALDAAVRRLRSEIGDGEFLRWIPYVHFGV